MKAGTGTRIHNLDSLLLEKEKLLLACKNSETQLEQHFDRLRTHAVSITVNTILLPALKQVFKVEHLFNLLSMGQLVNTFSEAGQGNKLTLKNLGGLFTKGGWLMAVRLGFSILKKLMK